MALTHVRMWQKYGSIPITIEEARELFPEGTVKADSGILFCDLCRQYVILTKEGLNPRHFKHPPEVEKKCPEKSSDRNSNNRDGYYYNFEPKSFDLPIRIRFISDETDFELELGLPPLPKEKLSSQFRLLVYIDNLCVSHKNVLMDDEMLKRSSYEYLSCRLRDGENTFLFVGSTPAKSYAIKVEPENHPISDILPEQTNGIINHAIFDARTRKRVPSDSYIRVGVDYYMISRYKVDFPIECVIAKQFRARKSGWNVYNFKVNELNENSGNFFLKYGYRLDENAVLFCPIWPGSVKAPHVLLHQCGELYFFLRGSAIIKAYPSIPITIRKPEAENSQDFSVFSCVPSGRNQLIASGRLRVLKYAFIWEDELAMEGALPEFSVTTLDGEAIESGTINALPRKGKIVVSLEVDGFVERRSENVVVGKYLVKAKGENDIEVRDGDCIQIYVGLDKVWECTFVRKKTQTSAGDEALYQELVRCRGSEIAIPHAFGALAGKLKGYPKTMQWLRRCIREGKAVGRALLILERWLRREEDENS